MGGAQGQAQDIKVEAAQIMRIRDNLVKMYSMFTGQTTDQITKDLDRDNFMSAIHDAEKRFKVNIPIVNCWFIKDQEAWAVELPTHDSMTSLHLALNDAYLQRGVCVRKYSP